MARNNSHQPILPSLLDRLIDDDPMDSVAPMKSYGVVLSDIKNSIRRDLENLLNTRLYRQEMPAHLSELKLSVVNYGLPDFSTMSLSSDEGKAKFREEVQSIIERFEPRFKQVMVDLEQIGEDYQRTLYLKISAILMVDPEPIPLLFDSRVKSIDKAVRLREVNHG